MKKSPPDGVSRRSRWRWSRASTRSESCVAAIFFGALDNGSQAMQRAEGVSPVLVQVIQGMVILILLAFDTSAWGNLREAFARAPVVHTPVEGVDA